MTGNIDIDIATMGLTRELQMVVAKHIESWDAQGLGQDGGTALICALGGTVASVAHEIFQEDDRGVARQAIAKRAEFVANMLGNPEFDDIVQYNDEDGNPTEPRH